MKAKLFTTTLALAVLTGVFAPSTAEARDHRRGYKHSSYKKHYKNYHKHNPYRHYRPYRPVRYKAPKHKHENFSIYLGPGGGIGFHYSEGSRRYGGYPYYW